MKVMQIEVSDRLAKERLAPAEQAGAETDEELDQMLRHQDLEDRDMADPRIEIPKDRISDFCRRHHIRSLSLFGSVLREDFRPDSDVDVLVEFEPQAQIGFIALSRMQRELSELLQRRVDLVPRAGLKSRIRETILSSAEVVYAA